MSLVRNLVEQYLPVRYDRLHRPLEKRLSPGIKVAAVAAGMLIARQALQE